MSNYSEFIRQRLQRQLAEAGVDPAAARSMDEALARLQRHLEVSSASRRKATSGAVSARSADDLDFIERLSNPHQRTPGRIRGVLFFAVSRINALDWGRLIDSDSGDLPPIRVSRTTCRNWLNYRLVRLKLIGDGQVAALRRELQAAKEAARDRSVPADVRDAALAILEILTALIASLATEAFVRLRPAFLPRVLAAGGQSAVFLPRP